MNPLKSFLFWCGVEFLSWAGLLWLLLNRGNEPGPEEAFGFAIGLGVLAAILIVVSVIRSGLSWVRQRHHAH